MTTSGSTGQGRGRNRTASPPSTRERVDAAVAEGWDILAGLESARVAVREARSAESAVASADPTTEMRDRMATDLATMIANQDTQMEQTETTAKVAVTRAEAAYQEAVTKARAERDAAIARLEGEQATTLERAEQEQALQMATARAEVVAAERRVASILGDFEQYRKRIQGEIGFDIGTLIDVHE